MRILYHHRTLGDGAEGIHIREMVNAFSDAGLMVKVIGPVANSDGKVKEKTADLFSKIKRGMPTWFVELVEIAYGSLCFFKCLVEIVLVRPSFIYDRYSLYNFGCVLAGRVTSVPVFLEVNAPLAWERDNSPDESLSIKSVAYWFERIICSSSTKTIVVSSPLKKYLVTIGVPQEKILILPNGANPITFVPNGKSDKMIQSIGAENFDLIIGFTGIIRKWHGLELLVEAVAKARNAGLKIFLLIVGDGPARQEIEEYAEKIGLKGSYFISGRVPHDMVGHYVALFDIAVSPRSTFYASPMKVLEYMAVGKAVVVPNEDNFLDFVDPGINGEVFENCDSNSMAKVITDLVNDKEKCSQLGREARKKIETRLNWNWNAKAILDELSRVDKSL